MKRDFKIVEYKYWLKKIYNSCIFPNLFALLSKYIFQRTTHTSMYVYTLYIHAKYVYVEKYAYIYLLKWASFLDPLHCNEQQKWWRVRPQLRYVKSSVTSFFEKKVTCSPLRWTFLHLKTILGMIAHKINLKMTHAGIFFHFTFFSGFCDERWWWWNL